MNLQEQERFYQAFRKSRAASGTGQEDRRITEVVNGIITTRPAKKIEHLSTQETLSTREPEIIELGGKSKAGSVQENRLKTIHNFIKSNGRH